MKGIYKNCIEKLINTFMIDTEMSNNILFIKHYNTFNIKKKDMEDILLNNNNVKLLYHEYKSCEFQKAYDPILPWIKELYFEYFSDVEIDVFLDECDVYSLQKPIFKSYFEKGFCERDEDLIITEIRYEYERFLTSLYNILCYISLKIPLVIVLNKLHSSSLSILEFIKMFLNAKGNGKIALISTYNEAYNVYSYMSKSWKELIDTIDNSDVLYDWDMQDEKHLAEENQQFIPKRNEMEKYIREINNITMTLSTEQAKYYADIIYNKLDVEKMPIDNNLRLRFLNLYALINVYYGEYSKALLMCDVTRNLAAEYDYLNKFRAYYISGLAQVFNGKYYVGEEFSLKCKEIGKLAEDEYLLFKADVLKYTSIFRGWKGLFLCGFRYNIENEFVENVKKYNFKNHLAYVNLMGYENDDEDIIYEFEKAESFEHFNKSIEIAEEIKNYSFLLLAYNKMIILTSCYAKYDLVEEYYRRCIDIARGINDKYEEANILNGLGYNLIIRENYSNANKRFNSALKIFYDMQALEAVAETVYNMGINAFVADQYEFANEYLKITLEIIDTLQIGALRVCNISKIYGLLSLSNYYLGVEYNCYSYFEKLKRVVSHLVEPEEGEQPSYMLWDDDLFLYYLIQALINKREKKYDLAEINFKNAEKHMLVSTGSQFYSYPLFAKEMARYYKEIGSIYKANQILTQAIDFCEEKQYFNRANSLRSEMKNEGYIKKELDLLFTDVKAEQILNLAKIVGAEKELKEEKKELSFLLLWQDIFSKQNVSKEELINKSMIAIKNNFSLEKMLYISVNDELIGNIEYKDNNLQMSERDVKDIINYFNNEKRDFVICRKEKNFELYKDIVKVFGINKVFSMIGLTILKDEKVKNILIVYIPVYANFIQNKVQLNERNLYVIRYIFKQLLEEIYKLEVHKQIEAINKQLHQSAITDNLTGLYNRQGFEKQLELNQKLTIVYVDLDNFKYYNDNFGHDVGDYILVLLAEIFKKATYKKGYVVRYGGDEFILVVPNGNDKKGVGIAKYIYKAMAKESIFLEDIDNRIGKKIAHKISCSIGIATSTDGSKESIMQAIKNADEVLYEVKKTTKNDYRVYRSKSSVTN